LWSQCHPKKVGMESMYFQHHDYNESVLFSNDFEFDKPFDFALDHYD